MRALQSLKATIVNAEARWFDFSHGVRTAGFVELSGLTLASGIEHGSDYLASRPKNVRRALRALPVKDHSRFTFVDLGSGKGSVMFQAAQYPYRRIRGVEFARELHQQAVQNIATFHTRAQGCRDIESIYMDVRSFQYPADNLVIYFFNAFPPSTLESTLANLRESLNRQPREVFLISLYPDDLAPVLQGLPWLVPEQTTARYHIYRTIG